MKGDPHENKKNLRLLLTLLLTLAAVMAAHADESMPDTITADTISLEDIFSFLASVDDNSADSGELLSEGIWIYNEFHQPVAVENLPAEAPMILPYVMPKLSFEWDDQDLLTITPTMKNLDNGEETHSQTMNLIQIPITYNAEGLPIRVMETDTDIYEQLDFQVTSVQVGNYGYFLWPDPDVSNTELPELYRAGILGLPFDKTNVTMGKVFTLKIEGVTDSGEQAVFYVQPDPMGRFMGFELIDGHCTRWPLSKVNPDNIYQITVEE